MLEIAAVAIPIDMFVLVRSQFVTRVRDEPPRAARGAI